MTENEMVFAIGVYEPNAPFDWHGSLDAMVWGGSKPKPTQADLDALWPTVELDYYWMVNTRAREQRRAAYRDQADSLFFKWQRGESTEQEWLDKVEEIRARFPDLSPGEEGA